MKFRHSIVTRFALFFTGLIIFSILLSGYLVFKNASGVIMAYSKERILHTSELAEQSFYSLLNEVSNDIAVIENSPTLSNFINNPTQESVDEIKHFFKALLQNKGSYFQIRYIGVENNGQEVIRLDKLDGQVLESNELQEKGDKEYFKEAIKMERGEFYFSQINLNEEYGYISKPYTPTLRAASPIFGKDKQILGIVIINVDLTKFFKELENISGSELKFYLIDAEGQYLFANNKALEFGIQTKTNRNFYEDFDLNESIIKNDDFKDLNDKAKGDLLSYFKQLTYFKGARKLYLVSTMQETVFMQSAKLVRQGSLKTLLFVCLLCMVISWVFVTFFSRRINQVTKAISNYDEGLEGKAVLPIHRKDEIGALALTFTKMRSKIDQQVKELHQSLEKEKQAKMQRDEFLQNMSHEMRTPLNTILGLTKLLSKNTPSDAQVPIINSLERSANSLAGLVYDVLDHKKLIEGTLQLELEPINIAELLKDIHSTYQYDAIQKGLVFKLNMDKDIEESNFQMDALRLSQIVINLVVNAIKYTEKGVVELGAKIKNSTHPILEIKVKDTGIGIHSENLGKINDRFFREKEDLSGRYGGYGLGLSIVKQLTVLFGGELLASSEKGKGSEFCVRLHIIPVKKVNHKPSNDIHKLPELKAMHTILHIEDDLSTMELIKYTLENEKIKLVQLDKLEGISEFIINNNPDLIISDLMLHGQNIQDFLTNCIDDKKMACPLMLVSALEPEVMAITTSLYFQKPFNVDHLKDAIFKILGQTEFNAPDFSNLYSNYDNHVAKINKVLKLLETEFETYLKRIDLAFEHQNQADWEAILHKLIAHVNNLKLGSLKSLPQSIIEVTPEQLNNIKNAFAYYLCCFRVEGRANLKG